MTLPETALRKPVTTLTVIISLIVLGSIALMRMPLGFLPEVRRPVLFVQVPFPDSTPEQTERLLIRPLEEALGSVKGVKSMRSSCDSDRGRINLEFAWGHEMGLARAEILERIDRIRGDLPEGIGDITISSSWDSREEDQPVLEGRLSSNRNLSESYDVLENKIIRPLERINGVASIRLDGVNPREVRINLKLEALEAAGLDIRDVVRILKADNFDLSVGVIRSAQRRYSVRTIGEFSSIDEIAALPLRADGLRLGDVADVVFREPLLEYGRHLDGHFAVGVSVTAAAEANAVEVCDEVRRKIAEMRKDPGLEGIEFLIWFDQGKEIRKTLHDLVFTGIFGALLASIVLYGFLRRMSMTVIVVACIPFSLIVACGALWTMGRTMNTLTLLGLIVGVGMLVDNAVVVMENIFRHQQSGIERTRAALVGSREVSLAVIAATATSIIVFLPMIFNKPNEMNIYLRELAMTVCLTLIASLFISQTLIPLAAGRLIRYRKARRAPAMLLLENHFTRILTVILRRRWIAVVSGVILMLSAIYPFQHIDKNFDADSTEVFIQARYEFSQALSLKSKEKIIDLVEDRLLPEREALGAEHIYSFWSDRFSLTRIYMKEGFSNDTAMRAARQRLRKLIPEIPGVKIEVQDQTAMGRRRGGAKRIAFQIVGEDTGVLSELAAEAKKHLESIPGLVDPWTSVESGQMEISIDLDRESSAHYGISLRQPAEVVSLSFRGRRLRRFRTPSGERELRLTLDERDQQTLSDLQNLPVLNTDGKKIPLASMATFSIAPGPERIRRENRMTGVWVGARYEEGTMGKYLPQVKSVMDHMVFPTGYRWTMSDWMQRRREQSRDFLINLALALLLVFAVMAGLFESIQQALGLMISLPFAMAGAFWLLWATGTDFDQPAAIGLLLLIGIVVNNGIVMLEHINTYRRQGMDRFDAMIRGGRERLRPILMTAITTLVGLIPIVVQRPALAGIYYYSMALVLMGGLAISTVLTALMLPAVTSLLEDLSVRLGTAFRILPRAWSTKKRLSETETISRDH